MISSSSTTNPMENKTKFSRTQFFRFTGPDLCKIVNISPKYRTGVVEGEGVQTGGDSGDRRILEQ